MAKNTGSKSQPAVDMEESAERVEAQEPPAAPPGSSSGSARPGAQPEESAHQLQELATEYFGKVTEAAQLLTQQASEVYGLSQQYVRSHLGSSLVVSFGIGLFIGLLSGRS